MKVILFLLCLVAGLDAVSKFRKADSKTARQLTTLTTSNSAMAVGTQFVFSFLNSHLTAKDTSYTENLFLTITNPSALMATVSVSSVFSGFVNQTAQVPPKTSMIIPITPASIQVDYMDLQMYTAFKEFKSIWVSSNQPVKLVATNQHSDFGSEDSFAILPICQLGMQYQAIVDTSADPGTAQATNVITVIATQDNTNVTIRPIVSGFAVLKAGEQLSVAINLSVSSALISATAPVAAFSGAVCGFGFGQDRIHCSHEALQLIPITSYGTEYPVYKFKPEDYGDVLIFLTQDGTQLNENGINWDKTVGPSSYWLGKIDSGTYIKGNKPFNVAQVGNANLQDQGAPFLVNVAPPNLFTTGPVTFAAGLTLDETQNMAHFVRVVTDLNNIGMIKVDDYYPNGLLYIRMGKSNYYFIDVQIKQGQHVISSQNGIKFSVTVYGYGLLRSYGFNAGLDLKTTGVC